MLFFFFSSRRRHTRLTCDWSSDVCSSDLLSLVSHEQMEAVTDLSYRAWWVGDSNTGEIADICFTWAPLDEDGGKANQLWNGHYYILQQEYSNAAGGCVQEG